ncbi:MAG: hypothetical protein SCARUB_04634 [Candidatus Scalindua rubra]|uniref:Uncharacterized protein n=1 Tax=Candidatus Scalindua rubra TaxID=1872076 RepID=A0A1E3X3X9_9BACT|nr:MAG: hypothetical protein SCARUB_04634 [Candidatus Scalindua rubra]
MMTLKNQYWKRLKELMSYWSESFYKVVLTIDMSVSSISLMKSLIEDNELWPENDCRLPFLGSHENAIWPILDKLQLEEEIIKSSYIYIYSKLDGLLESMFAGRFSYSSDGAYEYLKKGFKKWYLENNIRSSENVARYRYLFMFDERDDEDVKRHTKQIEKKVIEWITGYYEKNDGMPLDLKPPKSMDLMKDLNKFNGKNRGIRNKIVHGGYDTTEDIKISTLKLIEVLEQFQRISTAAIFSLLPTSVLDINQS